MSYPYKTEHKEMSLHCNFLTIKHYYRKVKGACIIISFLKSLTSQGVYDFPYQSSSLLPIEAFPSLIALRHILQHRYHFLAKALRSQHYEIPAMPKHLLQEVVARANGQVIFTIHAVWRFPHPLLTLMQWHFLNVVVLRIEGTDANLLWLYIVHFIDAKAILVITIESQESLHLRRQRMLLANHLHIGNSVERKIPHSLLFIGKDIRWMQRLSNYDKAVARLQNAAKIIATEKQFSGEIDELLKEKKSQKYPHLSIIEDKNTNLHTFIHYKRQKSQNLSIIKDKIRIFAKNIHYKR